MLSIGTYLVICLFVYTIISGIIVICTNDRDVSDFFGISGTFVLCLMLSTLFGMSIPSNAYVTTCINNNDTDNVLRIKYQQYHTFIDDTVEVVMLMPDQAKILKDVKIVSEQYIKLSDLYKTNY